MENSKKNIYIMAGVSLVLIAGVIYFLFIRKINPDGPKAIDEISEQKQLSDLEIGQRPYVTLAPNATGTEIQISLENMSYFDSIDYELTYLSDNPQIAGEKIQRGATGSDINTKDAKSTKSAPLGTGSRGVFSADKGITEGKLILHLIKDNIEYLSETNWDLFESGLRATTLEDRSGNFSIKLPALGKDYWIIIADTVGVPPNQNFDLKKANLPIYGIFSLDTKFPKNADVTIKTNGVENPQLYKFKRVDSNWSKVDNTKFDAAGGTITASIDAYATFVIVSP